MVQQVKCLVYEPGDLRLMVGTHDEKREPVLKSCTLDSIMYTMACMHKYAYVHMYIQQCF